MNSSTSFRKTPSLLHYLRLMVLAIGLAGLAFGACADVKDDIKADMVAGRWQQADSKLIEVLKKHPDNALAHYWYAQVLEREGKTPAAREELATALKLAPTEQFAGNKDQLAKMMKRLGVAAPGGETVAATATPADPVPAPMTRTADDGRSVVLKTQPTPQMEPKSGFGGMTWILIIAGGLLVVLVVVSRRSGGSAVKQERDRWTAELNDASKDLADAQLVSDSNPALNEAQRLGNYDRVRLVKSDLSSHLASMPTRTDFQPTQSLVLRARDIAAELRGEERPSERLRRENQERMDREATMAANGPGQYGPGYAQQPRGGGLLRDAALLGGGALLGSMLSGSASARERNVGNDGSFGGGSGSLREVDDNGSGGFGGVDVGGSDAGSDFDLGGGGGDFGGGGSDDFS